MFVRLAWAIAIVLAFVIAFLLTPGVGLVIQAFQRAF